MESTTLSLTGLIRTNGLFTLVITMSMSKRQRDQLARKIRLVEHACVNAGYGSVTDHTLLTSFTDNGLRSEAEAALAFATQCVLKIDNPPSANAVAKAMRDLRYRIR